MKFEAEILGAENVGDEAEVTFTNVKRKNAAFWRSYSKGISVRMPFSSLKTFTIGRTVTIDIKAK